MTEQNGLERSSATEKLRRLLDEHGVEHKDFFDQTWWEDSDGAAYIAVETRPLDNNNPSTKLMLKRTATPEQAIAATFGSCNCSDNCSSNCSNSERTGKCHIEERYGGWFCTGCGELVGTCDTASELCMDGNAIELWNYCPNCGAKVIEPTTNDVDAEVRDD